MASEPNAPNPSPGPFRLFCARETEPGERRVALTPETARKFAALGIDAAVEAGAGAAAGFPDTDYAKAGARVIASRADGIRTAHLLLQVRPLGESDAAALARGTVHASFLDPFRQPDAVRRLAAAGLTLASMEMMPRTTIAQKMDALSSQASLAGYAAVLLAAHSLDRIFPMMMTPAGTLAPARVFIIGAGVAGLQAIATAKRLGARVEAFDTRPAVEEQVRSLGARFLKIDLGQTGQTAQGYAVELAPAQLDLQKQGMAKACAQADVVITTAQVFGRPAPRLISRDMLAGMRPGALVLDMAVSTGGNVEGSEPDRETSVHGVRVIGCSNLPNRVPHDASAMFASNLANFITHFWDATARAPRLDPADEIVKGCVIVRDGEIVHDRVKTALDKGA